MEKVIRREDKTLAVSALVLGFLGFITAGVTGLVGIILGIVSIRKISRSEASGRGYAITGVIFGVLSIALTLLFIFASPITPPPTFKADPSLSNVDTTVNPKKQVQVDVKTTVENIKSYLADHPRASSDALQTVKRANGDPKRESILISGDYRVWYVVGTSTAFGSLKENNTYQYQSYSNTYRGTNKLKNLPLTEDATPRNKFATGA